MKHVFSKLFALLLVSVFLLGIGVSAAVPGDINGDGECSVLDVLFLVKAVLNGNAPEGADINGDGRVNLQDVLRALKLCVSTDAPTVGETEKGSADITVENGATKDAVSLDGETVSAAVPAGVAVKDGTTALTLSVTALDETNGNITPGETEDAVSYDVHIEGVAENNTVPIIVDLGAILPVGQNSGTVTLYHIENGVATPMTQVLSILALDAHNEFYYDPATGTVFVALATFSEIALVSDTVNAWNGEFDYTWYTNPKAKATDADYIIANADQLAAFGAIVGGMAKDEEGNTIEADSFDGKTVKLLADINLGDDEKNNNANLIFYPIGYYNSEGTYEKTDTAISSGFKTFEGTFDGAGHTVSNFYQNTWEMKGDHDWYDATLQYYRDGMGLFGKVYGGTVKNLTVNNFSSDGEITTTGVIAAYADYGASFENIAITNCNPRVYNIGNGGIVGCVGWYTADETDEKVTFTNITVDNSNKISALWGSYDVACGGIVGQYYPTSGQSSANYPANAGIHFENCHVAAVMDVYNDVCANYQYYAYRYTGMMIGSIRENLPADANGHVYPNMNGITAENCTVHFGDWNDYYYCELVANSLASYTHDHQFSRLEQVKAVEGTTVTYLDGTTAAVPASGRYNYVVVKEKNADGMWIHGDGHDYAECYHFVDGKVWKHEDAGYETVDGVEVLKEDKQVVYREFNNLVTGYGWGVTSKGVGELDGVTILDRKDGSSVQKFVGKGVAELETDTVIRIGDLFTSVDNGVALRPDSLTVSVNDLDDSDGIVTGTFVRNAEKWEESTLTLSGMGRIAITIQDYHFCTPTTITVTVTERVNTKKFETKFKGDFLYRVGNQNTVALGSLFAEIGTEIALGTVNVTVESIAGDARGTYTANETWTAGTIQFSGTGVVKVTITDNDYCTPTELILEVVEAINTTTAINATKNNVVLLNDINGGFSVATGYGFYGNGFTITLNPNSHSTVKGNGYAGYIHMNGGTIDNVRIDGPVFAESNIYQSQALHSGNNADDPADYFRNGICIDSGDAVIVNSYVSGARVPVLVKSGNNVTIENTHISGGAYANIEILATNSLALKNVTTEQKVSKDSYGKNKDVIGLGIVINTADAKLILKGVTQYNWITKSQWDGMLGSYKDNFPALFTNDKYTNLQYTNTDNVTVVNTGIIYACDVTVDQFDKEIRNGEISGYTSTAVTAGGKQGIVYTKTRQDGDNTQLNEEDVNAPSYKAKTQNAVPPTATFDYTTKNNEPEQSGSNEYCYYNSDSNRFLISFDEGSSKDWSYDILTVKKGNNTLSYSVSVTGNGTVNGSEKTVTFREAGDYTVTYTYDDPYNYKLNNGKIEDYDAIYTKEINITVFVVEPESAPTTFAFGNDGYKSVSAGGLTYVMPNVTATKSPTKSDNVVTASGIGSKVIDGETIYYPIIGMHKVGSTMSYYNYFSVFEAVTINDANGTDKYNTDTTSMPSNLQVIGGFINNGTESANGTAIFNYSTGKTIKTKTVTVKGKNVGLCYYPDSSFSSSTTARDEQTIVVKYCYTDTNGKAYYYYIGYWCAQGKKGVEPSGGDSPCVTPDTLITLADGTQKRIDEITCNDKLLVWNFYTGTHDVASSAIIFNHGYDTNTIIKLTFSDGTTVKVANLHQFFDVDSNRFVTITADSVETYLNHRFVKLTDEAYTYVTLVDYSISEEYEGAYGIISAEHYNIIVEGMLSTDFMEKDYGLFNYFEIGENMKYDEAKMQADIEKFGLYVYDDFADYLSHEEFIAFNCPYMKVSIGKGQYTFEEILKLIAFYLAD